MCKDICGDGFVVQADGFECDDRGINYVDDGCNGCMLDMGFVVVAQLAVDTGVVKVAFAPQCGDDYVHKLDPEYHLFTSNIVDLYALTGPWDPTGASNTSDPLKPGEQCDDNQRNVGVPDPQSGDGCSEYCQIEVGFYCIRREV